MVLRAGHKLLTIVFSPALPEKRGKGKHQRDPQEIQYSGGFPGGAVVENLPANAGDASSSPGLGRSHMPRSN